MRDYPERLAEVIKVDRTTLSRAVRKLEENGFILKESDPFNKKSNIYTQLKKESMLCSLS